MRFTKTITMLLVSLMLTIGASAKTPPPNPVLPNPVLYMSGADVYTTGGTTFVRYSYDVLNKDAYPDALFAAAPALPPCGLNKNSSRSWVDIFDQRGKRLNGFCAFGKANDLGRIWFALPEGEVPPSWIYIEINDRETNTKYKSNLAETTM